MTRQFLILILFFASCTSEESDNVSTKIIGKGNQKLLTKTDSQTIINYDTIFLKREINQDYYHAIYIDTNRNSKCYNWITNFKFDSYDLQAYNGNYKYFKNKNPKAFSKLNSIDSPKEWIPVYQHNKNYYLYAPSDWGNAGKRIINDSAFVYWYMDGPLPIPLTNVKKVSQSKMILEMMELFNENPSTVTLTVHQIDPKSGLSVFEFSNESEKSSYQLYLPAENAKRFDIIVNFCENQKQREFTFDEIDYEKLIKTAANNGNRCTTLPIPK